MDTESGSTSSEIQVANVPVFGARKKAKELAEQVNELLKQLAATVARLGQTMDIHISGAYHELREYELTLTADYRQKLAEDKEREREEKERLREERKAQQEMERERARLEGAPALPEYAGGSTG